MEADDATQEEDTFTEGEVENFDDETDVEEEGEGEDDEGYF